MQQDNYNDLTNSQIRFVLIRRNELVNGVTYVLLHDDDVDDVNFGNGSRENLPIEEETYFGGGERSVIVLQISKPMHDIVYALV